MTEATKTKERPASISDNRVPAPDIAITEADIFGDEAGRIADEFNEANPDFNHKWQRIGVTQNELTRKHQEVVQDPERKGPYEFGDRVLVRVPKAIDTKIKAIRNERSARMAETFTGGKVDIRKVAKPVTPRIVDDGSETPKPSGPDEYLLPGEKM